MYPVLAETGGGAWLNDDEETGGTAEIDVGGLGAMGVVEAVGVVGDAGISVETVVGVGTAAAAAGAAADTSATCADVGAPTKPFDGDAVGWSSVTAYGGGGGFSAFVVSGNGTCFTAASALAPVGNPFGDGRVYTGRKGQC